MEPAILISAPGVTGSTYRSAVRGGGGPPQGGYCPPADLSCAGLLLCGGGDADPALYGAENRGSQPPDPRRDRAELALIDAFLSAGKPVLGICRGFQMLNIALGGTLIQDLPPELAPFHHGEEGDRIHPVRTAPGRFLGRLYGPVLAVNSSHHQAAARLGEGLIPCAWSEGGVAEAAEHVSLPVLGVQFHPERMSWDRRRPDAADGAPILLHVLSLCVK